MARRVSVNLYVYEREKKIDVFQSKNEELTYLTEWQFAKLAEVLTEPVLLPWRYKAARGQSDLL